ncbi:MAG: hypothetical protein LBK95_21380, partial [Bifidobacteriaceae bacterium]|nr:hypothetical protein [Bifidobacteriaceae bacterium]
MAEHTGPTENTRPAARFPNWVARVLAVALGLAVVVGLAVLARLDVLSWPRLLVIGLVAVLVAAGVAVALWRTRVPPSWFRFVALSLVALLGIGVSAMGVKAIS